jgi:hypothetical protein
LHEDIRMTYNSAYTGPQIDAAARLASIIFDDLPALLADARTYSEHTAGDVFWTAAEGFRYRVAASGATDHHLTTAGGAKLYVLPTPEGAIPLAACNPALDTESHAASAANQAAFGAAITAAVRLGIETIVLPTGTFWMRADSGLVAGSGLRINVPDGKTIKFFGQSGTVIKRIALAPPIPLVATSSLVFMSANTGITIEWHHVTFDGNEANCEYDPEDTYADQQSSNIAWIGGTGRPKRIGFFHCDVGLNRVGDGYKQSLQVDHFMAANCTTEKATVRRTRADWQFSKYATYETVMTNIVCNSWESEPSGTPEGSRLILSNVLSHGVFDLAGDSSISVGDRYPVLAHLTNVVCLCEPDASGFSFTNFFRVHGSAVNCHFRGVDRIQRCKIKFIGGSFTMRDNGSGVADSVEIWHDHDSEASEVYIDNIGSYVEFNGVTFKKDPTVTTGRFVKTEVVVEAAAVLPDVPLPRTSLINCDVPEAIDYVLVSSRAGVVEVRGGDLRANVAIAQFDNDTSRVAHLHCEARMLWDAPALLRTSNLTMSTGEIIMNINGEYDGENMLPLDNGPRRIADGGNIKWNVNAVAFVNSNPQGRIRTLPGLRAKLQNQTYGGPTMWEAIPTGTMTATGYNGTDWRAIAGGAKKGNTAGRPTGLGVYDIGFSYYDTTLDADGLPIFWQGAKWIRADGTDA